MENPFLPGSWVRLQLSANPPQSPPPAQQAKSTPLSSSDSAAYRSLLFYVPLLSDCRSLVLFLQVTMALVFLLVEDKKKPAVRGPSVTHGNSGRVRI